MKKMSIIIPVYNNEKSLLSLYSDLKEKVLEKISKINLDYEIVMINDGSKDSSYKVMRDLVKIDKKIIAVKLSRNFGEHEATLAGLSVCTGDFAVRKAADLQEPSEMILDMIKKYNEGNKVVFALRKSRQDKMTDIIASKIYTKIIQKYALKNMPDNGVDSYLIDRQVIDFLVNLNQGNAPLTELILWSGYEYGSVYYDRAERKFGKSGWTFSKKVKMLFDSLFGFSYVPIRYITGVGLSLLLITLISVVVLIIRKIRGITNIAGYNLTILVILFALGMVMLSIGIIGEYVWRALDAAKNKPVFVIESINDETRKKKQNTY